MSRRRHGNDAARSGSGRAAHGWPRSRAGRILLYLFVGLMALTQWPALTMANRIEPTIGGMPFLFVYLLVLYAALIGVLVTAAWWEL